MSTKYIFNNIELSDELKEKAIDYLEKRNIKLSPLLFRQALDKVR